MLTRRQALRSREPALHAISMFLLTFFLIYAAPILYVEALRLNSAARTHLAPQLGIFVLLLVILSAVTVFMGRHHRRDVTSPRRIGRRN